jgi:hypothetical protein
MPFALWDAALVRRRKISQYEKGATASRNERRKLLLLKEKTISLL